MTTTSDTAKEVEKRGGYCLSSLSTALRAISFSSSAITQQYGGSFSSEDAANRIWEALFDLKENSDRLREIGGDLWDSWELAAVASGEPAIEIGSEECLTAWEATRTLVDCVELLVGKYHVGEWNSESPERSEARRRTDCHRLAAATESLATEELIVSLDKRLRRECVALRAMQLSAATGLTLQDEPKKKTRLSRSEANILAREVLQKLPEISARDLAAEIGCSVGLVPKLESWRAVREKLDQGAKPKRAKDAPGPWLDTAKNANVAKQVSTSRKAADERDEALDELIREQQADLEPSPLDDQRGLPSPRSGAEV